MFLNAACLVIHPTHRLLSVASYYLVAVTLLLYELRCTYSQWSDASIKKK